MDNGLNDKIRQLLSDPSSVEKIISVVNGMAPQSAEAPPPTDITAAAQPQKPEDSRLKLLGALKSLLRAEKQAKIDNLQRALTMATLFGDFKLK